MKTCVLHEYEESKKSFRDGKGMVRIESGTPDERIGKIIRMKLEQAKGAAITVTYDVISDDMQRAAQVFG